MEALAPTPGRGMASLWTRTEQLQRCLDRFRAGDPEAEAALLAGACDRLARLAHKMLRRYPRVRRWEDTADVVQNVVLRLRRALHDVRPADIRDFFRLAALNTRRELLDLVKHYYGPRGAGARHESVAETSSGGPGLTRLAADVTGDPARLAAWAEFHRQVEALPDDEREVFDLLWYEGLTQAEAAELLGVTERTVQRRWQAARLALYDALGGELPPGD
jgi:RNA polymerase sigma-70 factor (ECF subfamily)